MGKFTLVSHKFLVFQEFCGEKFLMFVTHGDIDQIFSYDKASSLLFMFVLHDCVHRFSTCFCHLLESARGPPSAQNLGFACRISKARCKFSLQMFSAARSVALMNRARCMRAAGLAGPNIDLG